MENKSDQGALVSAALLCKEPSPLISNYVKLIWQFQGYNSNFAE